MFDGRLRIGEFSDRVGVRPDLLRAWERRYGLVSPQRSEGGFRLYSEDDVARVLRMRALLDEGLAAAEAARLARAEAGAAAPVRVPAAAPPGELPEGANARLLAALSSYDEQGAHAHLDEVLTTVGIERALTDVVLPVMAEVGDRWAAGELSVSAEHFAAGLVRGRLLALARGWGQGIGPRALLATPPDEDHDLGLVAFGLVLWRRGWRITHLGANTPVQSLVDAVQAIRPDAIVLSSVLPGPLRRLAGLHAAAPLAHLAIGGAGASAGVAADIGAIHLEGDVVTAADALTRRHVEGDAA